MGHIEIDLNDLQIEKTYHQWKGVENDGEINGQIFILVTISGTTSEDATTNLSRLENEIERYITYIYLYTYQCSKKL